MTPLALFLLGCAMVFLGAIEVAFSTLMRLSLRLMAERGGRSDRLGRYLDDPLQLFVPVRHRSTRIISNAAMRVWLAIHNPVVHLCRARAGPRSSAARLRQGYGASAEARPGERRWKKTRLRPMNPGLRLSSQLLEGASPR